MSGVPPASTQPPPPPAPTAAAPARPAEAPVSGMAQPTSTMPPPMERANTGMLVTAATEQIPTAPSGALVSEWMQAIGETEWEAIPDVEIEDEKIPEMGPQQVTAPYMEGAHPNLVAQQVVDPTRVSSRVAVPKNAAEMPNGHRQHASTVPPALQQPLPTATAAPNSGVPQPMVQQEPNDVHIRESLNYMVASPEVANKSLQRCQKASTAALQMTTIGLRAAAGDALNPFNSQAIVTAARRRELAAATKEDAAEPSDRAVSPSASTGKASASKKRRQRRVIRKASSNGVGATCSGTCYQSVLQLTSAVERSVDEAVVKALTVTPEKMAERYKALRSVCNAAKDALRFNQICEGMRFYVYGSVHLRTVLPSGDNDVTLVLESANVGGSSTGNNANNTNSTMASSSHSASNILAIIKDYIDRRNGVDGIRVDKLVQAPDVQVLKLDANAMHVDLSINQMGGTATSCFLHEVDSRIGRHLLKSTLILLKAWCSYEAHILGSDNGYLGTYALSVMLIAVINGLPEASVKKGIPSPRAAACEQQDGEGTTAAPTAATPVAGEDVITLTPLKLFLMFLDYYATFDFDQYAITIHGPVAVEDLQTSNVTNANAAVAFAKQHRLNNIAAASPVELNKANGASVIGRRASACIAAGGIGSSASAAAKDGVSSPTLTVSAAGPTDSPTVTPRLSPRGLMSTPTDGDDASRVAEPRQPYPSPCISKDTLKGLVARASAIDEAMVAAQRAFYVLHQGGGVLTSTTNTTGAVGSTMSESAVNLGSADGAAASAAANEGAEGADNNANSTLLVNYFRVRMMNIRDPLRPFSNLTRGVTRNHLARIQGSFKRGAKSLRTFISQSAAAADTEHNVGYITPTELVAAMFPATMYAISEDNRPSSQPPNVDRDAAAAEENAMRSCGACRTVTPFCNDLTGNTRFILEYPAVDPNAMVGGGMHHHGAMMGYPSGMGPNGPNAMNAPAPAVSHSRQRSNGMQNATPNNANDGSAAHQQHDGYQQQQQQQQGRYGNAPNPNASNTQQHQQGGRGGARAAPAHTNTPYASPNQQQPQQQQQQQQGGRGPSNPSSSAPRQSPQPAYPSHTQSPFPQQGGDNAPMPPMNADNGGYGNNNNAYGSGGGYNGPNSGGSMSNNPYGNQQGGRGQQGIPPPPTGAYGGAMMAPPQGYHHNNFSRAANTNANNANVPPPPPNQQQQQGYGGNDGYYNTTGGNDGGAGEHSGYNDGGYNNNANQQGYYNNNDGGYGMQQQYNQQQQQQPRGRGRGRGGNVPPPPPQAGGYYHDPQQQQQGDYFNNSTSQNNVNLGASGSGQPQLGGRGGRGRGGDRGRGRGAAAPPTGEGNEVP